VSRRWRPEAGFAGREAGCGSWWHVLKEGARGGNMGFPTLSRIPETRALVVLRDV